MRTFTSPSYNAGRDFTFRLKGTERSHAAWRVARCLARKSRKGQAIQVNCLCHNEKSGQYEVIFGRNIPQRRGGGQTVTGREVFWVCDV